MMIVHSWLFYLIKSTVSIAERVRFFPLKGVWPWCLVPDGAPSLLYIGFVSATEHSYLNSVFSAAVVQEMDVQNVKCHNHYTMPSVH